MPNVAVISQQALESIPPEASREDRLHIALKILRTLEDSPNNCTHRLSTALRAVLQKVLAEHEGPAEEKKITIDALQRLKRIDPRVKKRAAKQGKGTDPDLLASLSSGTGTAPAGATDEWEDSGPLSVEESFRLVDVQRPFQTYVRGQFVLVPGADVKNMIESALDGRPFNVTTFQKLHRHLSGNFSSGGVSLTDGPLFAEVTRILTEQGALPSVDPSAPTYGEQLMEELQARN